MLVNFNFAKHVNVIKITFTKIPRQTKIFARFKDKDYKAEQTNYIQISPGSLENQNTLSWGSSE